MATRFPEGTSQPLPVHIDWRSGPPVTRYYAVTPASPSRKSLALAGILFLLTLCTCLVAGAQFSVAFAHNESVSMDEFVRDFKLLYQHPAALLSGLPFALTLLTILLAHELGHLVMHNPLRGELATIEQQANSFAAELLLPEAAMRRVITPPVSILSLSRLKPIWKVAIQALIRRAHDLRIITQRQYTYLFEQIGVRGWRIEEPNFNLVAEKPRALRKMAEMLYGAPINYGQLARDLSLPISWIKSLLEVYAEGGEVTHKKKPVLVSLKPSPAQQRN